ncbi:MAG: capsular biosynthesis protein [Actinobacteria bacterium]|nr:MAG: capsular biosynthesis protein [Actinomycetota bacterium]
MLVSLLTFVAVTGCGRRGDDVLLWQEGTGTGAGIATPTPEPSALVGAGGAVSISATGDIVMGNAPDQLPPEDGVGFFDSVKEALAADLVTGNLEQPLTDDTGTTKCEPDAEHCHQFRAPPHYAAHLRDAGFTLLNQANNHGHDFGPAGFRNTQTALEAHGIHYTGAAGQITVVEAGKVRVAVVGFSPYAGTNSVVDIPAAKRLIQEATTKADLVVVHAHMGAEGADKTQVRPGTEMFLGENRGDPIAFSRAVVDAGADLVIGHGPHVLRGMEFYKGRLIAYSLGNFAGGGRTLSNRGPLGLGGVLRVALAADGSWVSGQFVSTYMDDLGRPTIDHDGRALKLLRELSEADFPTSAPRFAEDGTISPAR